jgi:hypothetical protein
MKLIVWAILLVLACLSTLAFGGKPPPRLMAHLNTLPIVYNQYCRVPSMKLEDVSCLIYYNQAEDIVYVVLFDETIGITHIIQNSSDKKETLVWCHFKVCL